MRRDRDDPGQEPMTPEKADKFEQELRANQSLLQEYVKLSTLKVGQIDGPSDVKLDKNNFPEKGGIISAQVQLDNMKKNFRKDDIVVDISNVSPGLQKTYLLVSIINQVKCRKDGVSTSKLAAQACAFFGSKNCRYWCNLAGVEVDYVVTLAKKKYPEAMQYLA